jgi:hypothetical protein
VSDASELVHTLLPLRLAAEVIFSKVYAGGAAMVADRDQQLDSIASTLAVLAAIYEYTTDSHHPARRLSRFETEGGMFRGGARELHFIDGRRPRISLAVAANDVTTTIERLKKAAL